MFLVLPATKETRVWCLGLEDSPGEGNGNSLQYFCLENPKDRGAWRATVHGVSKSWRQLSEQSPRCRNLRCFLNKQGELIYFFGTFVIIISIFQNLGGAILNLSHGEEGRAGGKEKQWEGPHAHHLSHPHTQPQRRGRSCHFTDEKTESWRWCQASNDEVEEKRLKNKLLAEAYTTLWSNFPSIKNKYVWKKP